MVAGLVLVAYEVRQATLQAEAATSRAFVTGVVDSRRDMALSPGLAERYVKENTSGVETLTSVEKFRLAEWEQGRRTRMIGQIIQYRMVLLDRGALEAMLPSLTSLEKGLWADLEIGPIRGFADVIQPIREEMGLLDQ